WCGEAVGVLLRAAAGLAYPPFLGVEVREFDGAVHGVQQPANHAPEDVTDPRDGADGERANDDRLCKALDESAETRPADSEGLTERGVARQQTHSHDDHGA